MLQRESSLRPSTSTHAAREPEQFVQSAARHTLKCPRVSPISKAPLLTNVFAEDSVLTEHVNGLLYVLTKHRKHLSEHPRKHCKYR